MRIHIFFNWPVGKNSAEITVTRETKEDLKYRFEVGIVPNGGQRRIYWIKKSPVASKEINNSNFFATKKDIVVVDIITETGERKRREWDLEKEWPDKAIKDTSVDTSWLF